jgi:flagellar assembly protein FliH
VGAAPVSDDLDMSDGEGGSLDAQLADAHARGIDEGRALAQQELAAERARLVATVHDIGALRRQILDAAENDVMRLAVAMARRVLHREVQLDPDILLAMARVALGRLGTRVVASAHLHPDDLAAVSRPGVAIEGVTLIADAEVPRGGCRLVSPAGEIDLGVDAQMAELSRVLLGERTDTNHVHLH